jgi:hypothetical protein
MSKQYDAKLASNWKKNYKWPVCGNCSGLTYNTVDKSFCSFHRFKVDRSDTCKCHTPPGPSCGWGEKELMHRRIIEAM